MKKRFMVHVWREEDWFIASTIDEHIASQGKTEAEALANVREAIELRYETLNDRERLYGIDVEIGGAEWNG